MQNAGLGGYAVVLVDLFHPTVPAPQLSKSSRSKAHFSTREITSYTGPRAPDFKLKGSPETFRNAAKMMEIGQESTRVGLPDPTG